MLILRTLVDVKAVMMEVLEDSLDFNNEGRKLKYGTPDMREHDVEGNTSFDLLHMICGDPGTVDHFDLPKPSGRGTASLWSCATPRAKLASRSVQ